MDTLIKWKGKMSFTGSAESGFSVPLGTSPAVGGDNDGFKPLELMAISLGGCTAMDVISILAKKRQEIRSFDVKVHVEHAEQHPKVFTSGHIEYHIGGYNIDEESVKRAIELSQQKYCPAQAMLSKVFPISLSYYIYDGDESEGRLLKKGTVE